MPFFSIIIPTFNSAKTLSLALESLVRQSFTDFDILIMDGLSSDATMEIARSYNDKRIKISSEKDNGIYDAMNKGIKLAKGDWVYFLGSDDRLFDSNVLQQISSEIISNNYNIIYGDVMIKGETGWAKDGQIYDGEFSLPKLIEQNICHQAIFYKKTVFETCGIFNSEYNICADWDLNLRLWAIYSFHYIKTTVAVFKGGNSSYQIVNNYAEIEKWINISRYFNFKILSRQFSPFAQRLNLLSRYYFKKGKYLKSVLFLTIFYLHKARMNS
jgi:glycosyltransferase involved in cell wall biosynthesis